MVLRLARILYDFATHAGIVDVPTKRKIKVKASVCYPIVEQPEIRFVVVLTYLRLVRSKGTCSDLQVILQLFCGAQIVLEWL